MSEIGYNLNDKGDRDMKLDDIREQTAIRMCDLPTEFIDVLRIPIADPELVALDHLVEPEERAPKK